MMRKTIFSLSLITALTLTVATANAGDITPPQQSTTTGRVITRANVNATAADYVAIRTNGRQHLHVVVEGAPIQARVITRHNAPGTDVPKLIRVQVINGEIFIDPTADYQRQGHNLTQANGIIQQAQRVWQSRVLNRARVVRGSNAASTSRPLPQPRMIFERPDQSDQLERPEDKPAKEVLYKMVLAD